MSNLFTKYVGYLWPSLAPESVQEVEAVQQLYTAGDLKVASLPRIPQDYCAECGGFFRPEFLKHIFRGTAILFENGIVGIPHFETVYYCARCEPSAPIVFTLESTNGEVLDERCFRVEEGFFQDIDGETGEVQYVISEEEYTDFHCGECGEVIADEAKCKSCRPQPKNRSNAKRKS
jgi:predicted RNA-binding Zn-ribbon protein involved in translation (DUF1610 family)